ncbi:MAG TPA: hypothetical protein VMD98_05805 [Bryocella sp.]|nr:hypothetical protein [Bryocella sp.]
MKQPGIIVFLGLLSAALCLPAAAAPLSNNARTVIPQAVQQIISVDYRELRDSSTARALKNQVIPDNVKQFEAALRSVGLDPERDAEQITFVSYRGPKNVTHGFGIVQGPFKQKDFLARAKAKKIKPEKYLLSDIYSMGSGFQMVFLDPITILFGDNAAIKGAIDVRDNGAASLASNDTIDDLISSIESEPVWSVLDQAGTQNMVRSALGQAGALTNFDAVKKRLLASDYVMDFTDGVTFNLTVKTSDNVSAASLSGLMQAGILYRKLSGSPSEKLALENTTVDSSDDLVQMHFATDDQRFQALMKSDLFAAVSR